MDEGTAVRRGERAERLMATLLTSADQGVLMFGVTPPRLTAAPERIAEIVQVTTERLRPIGLDGLALYDVDDESDRSQGDRPFPYLPTLDPAVFHAAHLAGWSKPVAVYRCVGKYAEDELAAWMASVDLERVLGVFVGASSQGKPVQTSLQRAYELRRQLRPDLVLGAVAISERRDEHERMLAKQVGGCDVFITQVTYNVDAAKSLVSEYVYACRDRGLQPRPVIFTLSVCGSAKTLDFLTWLGVDVPRWLQNALRNSTDPLTESVEHCITSVRELTAFCRRLGAPFGFSVESVSIRRAEIEASVSLAAEIRARLNEPSR